MHVLKYNLSTVCIEQLFVNQYFFANTILLLLPYSSCDEYQ